MRKGVIDTDCCRPDDVSISCQGGQTALMHAAEGGHEAIFQSLVSAGCDVNVKDNVRMTS